MLTSKGKSKGGTVLAAVGLAAGLLVTSAEPSAAGPFSWLRGKNQQQDQQGEDYSSGGGGGGLFGGLFRGSRPSVAAPEDSASVLPQGDPEVAMITNPALGMPTLSPRNIAATKAAIEKYKAIVAQGGWPTVPAKVMKPGMRGPEIVTLHRRLEISGDLVGMSIPDEYDQALIVAVKRFQARSGLPPTGIVDSRAAIDALNVPASIRLMQLQVNLKRLQHLAPHTGSRYVMVNIPSAQVEAVDSGQVIQRQAAVVGKEELQTPELSSKIKEINFNPYWYVPRSIIQNDLVPKARQFASRGQSMLAAYHMEAFDQAGNPLDPRQIDWSGTDVYNYSYRQLPWKENSLGFVKINFPNKDSVYMHDTPLQSLFGKPIRFDSHGCVRVHNVGQLVAWILQDNPGWNLNRVLSMKQTGEQLDVPVARQIPVYFTYITAWGTPDGQVHFRPDVYHHDDGSETASAD